MAPRDYSRTAPRENFRGSRDADRSRAYDGNVRRGGGIYRGYSGSYNRGYSGSYNRGYSGSYNRGYNGRSYSYGSRGYRSYAPIRFYRPYYSFRPRLSLGFGLWVGYPVPYYDPFYYPDYSYSYPAAPYPAYPQSAYPPSAYPSSPYPQTVTPQSGPDTFDDAIDEDSNDDSLDVQPQQANTGGLSFDITPTDAEVIVDGRRVGSVDQFTPTSQPLGLLAGKHRVEVRAPGYKTITFDVNVVAGQVIPYQGSLER